MKVLYSLIIIKNIGILLPLRHYKNRAGVFAQDLFILRIDNLQNIPNTLSVILIVNVKFSPSPRSQLFYPPPIVYLLLQFAYVGKCLLFISPFRYILAS